MSHPLTPLPWKIKLSGGDTEIVGANGDTVADNVDYYPAPINPEDAAFIVQACNSRDAMLGALRAAKADLNAPGHQYTVKQLYELIDAAIKLAEA